MTRRAYDNSARLEAARVTRARILSAARDLLTAHGYAALTINDLARRAAVSPQTVYNSVGGKAEVLKACYDVTLAGDDEPVPMSRRPQFLAMSDAPDASAFIDRYAAWCRLVNERTAPIMGALSTPGAGDAGASEFAATVEVERRVGTTHALTALRDSHGLRPGLTLQRAIDATWTLNAPEVYDRLVRRSGWSPAAYERWLAVHLRAALI